MGAMKITLWVHIQMKLFVVEVKMEQVWRVPDQADYIMKPCIDPTLVSKWDQEEEEEEEEILSRDLQLYTYLRTSVTMHVSNMTIMRSYKLVAKKLA